jgi:hypothetical protein
VGLETGVRHRKLENAEVDSIETIDSCFVGVGQANAGFAAG